MAGLFAKTMGSATIVEVEGMSLASGHAMAQGTNDANAFNCDFNTRPRAGLGLPTEG